MNYRMFFAFCSTFVCSMACHGISSQDLKALLTFLKNNPSAEDVVINNTVVMRGKSRELDAKRYEIIGNSVAQYRRPVTIVDLDARSGYFSFRLAHDFDAVCVMLTREELDFRQRPGNMKREEIFSRKQALKQLCLANTRLKNIILLEDAPCHATLKQLGDCEHFDIILARDLLYDPAMSIGEWILLANTILGMGERIIVELSPRVVGTLMYDVIVGYIIKHRGERLVPAGLVDGNTPIFYLISQPKTSLGICGLGDPRKNRSPYIIKSDLTGKVFSRNGVDRPWYPGIGFLTFRALHGLFPTDEMIFEHIEAAAPRVQKHSNVLIQGDKLIVLP